MSSHNKANSRHSGNVDLEAGRTEVEERILDQLMEQDEEMDMGMGYLDELEAVVPPPSEKLSSRKSHKDKKKLKAASEPKLAPPVSKAKRQEDDAVLQQRKNRLLSQVIPITLGKFPIAPFQPKYLPILKSRTKPACSVSVSI